MKEFTVIGIYASTGQVIVDWMTGDTASDAVERAVTERDDEDYLTLAVFAGHHQDLFAPKED